MKIEQINPISSKYRGFVGRSRWSLCIGAGVSAGIIPTWLELTRRVYNRTFNTDFDENKFKCLVTESSWSLDGWLQSCLNRYSQEDKTQEGFALLIREVMYEDLLNKAEKYNLRQELILSFNDPFRLHYEKINSLITFFDKEYPNSSTVQLVRFLLSAKYSDKLPAAIISTNADSVFDMLLYIHHMKYEMDKKGVNCNTRKTFARITKTVEYNQNGLIPIFHIHGCLFPNDGVKDFQRRKNSISKLVFDESSYLKIADSTYNWAQTTFMYHAQFDQLIFVGMSMSDPNIRKWLVWTSENHNAELREARSTDVTNLNHVWITLQNKELAIESALIHLGIRVAQIENWGQLEDALNNLLATKSIIKQPNNMNPHSVFHSRIHRRTPKRKHIRRRQF